MGVQGGVDNLQWLFTGTLLTMLAFNPLFGIAGQARCRGKHFISITYRFFMSNLMLFVLVSSWLRRVIMSGSAASFFIWASVFNLFVVSVFWALIVDVFNSEQGKRLFGFLCRGRDLGAVLGSTVIVDLGRRTRPDYLLLASARLLEIAVLAARRLSRLSDCSAARRRGVPGGEENPLGGGVGRPHPHGCARPICWALARSLCCFLRLRPPSSISSRPAIVAKRFAIRAGAHGLLRSGRPDRERTDTGSFRSS